MKKFDICVRLTQNKNKNRKTKDLLNKKLTSSD